MSNWSLPLLLVVFVAAAAAIWVAGVQLSNQTDVLSTRLHLGSALGGLILLAVATNLPELAITVSAALSGNIGVAVGNILGGIALQTVVLVALDAFGVKGKRPLTYRAASLVLVLEALLVVAILAVVIAGSRLPSSVILWRFAPGGVLIAVLCSLKSVPPARLPLGVHRVGIRGVTAREIHGPEPVSADHHGSGVWFAGSVDSISRSSATRSDHADPLPDGTTPTSIAAETRCFIHGARQAVMAGHRRASGSLRRRVWV